MGVNSSFNLNHKESAVKYLVSYDLKKEEKNYPRLINEIKAIKGKRLLFSQWVVACDDKDAKSLYCHLREFVDDNDRLLIVAFGGDDWFADIDLQVAVNVI